MTKAQLFSIDPDPPRRGKYAKLYYSGAKPWKAICTWEPPNGLAGIGGDGTYVEFLVPADATSVIFQDASGVSADLPCAVGRAEGS